MSYQPMRLTLNCVEQDKIERAIKCAIFLATDKDGYEGYLGEYKETLSMFQNHERTAVPINELTQEERDYRYLQNFAAECEKHGSD